ncbi:hypothetical protein [Rhodoferax sp.]|uniref:hypothetical protein n=1 Tax=Rhodoferax sp. TaxID=50421 RepID=UPI00283FD974|nr:hypothetical protein [Rhodoferax sp.]MDR3369274.1 hypothetical protein [Rhodoferax sp.]
MTTTLTHVLRDVAAARSAAVRAFSSWSWGVSENCMAMWFLQEAELSVLDLNHALLQHQDGARSTLEYLTHTRQQMASMRLILTCQQ